MTSLCISEDTSLHFIYRPKKHTIKQLHRENSDTLLPTHPNWKLKITEDNTPHQLGTISSKHIFLFFFLPPALLSPPGLPLWLWVVMTEKLKAGPDKSIPCKYNPIVRAVCSPAVCILFPWQMILTFTQVKVNKRSQCAYQIWREIGRDQEAAHWKLLVEWRNISGLSQRARRITQHALITCVLLQLDAATLHSFVP